MSAVDQKRAFNKLKRDLEPYRNLIVLLDSVLTWEKNYYPGIVWGFVSLFFLILWQMDLSLITMAALGCLMILAFDNLYPTVARFIFSSDSWNGAQEEKFEHVCQQLCNVQQGAIGFYDYIFTVKERKSTMFCIMLTAALIVLAWIGAVINNLFLMYVVILSVVLYPGLREKKFCGMLESKLDQVRQKIIKSD